MRNKLKLRLAVVALVVGWLACGVLAQGVYVADFYYEYPTLQDEPRRVRRLCARSTPFILFGPITLFVALTRSGFAEHGVMWREPRR